MSDSELNIEVNADKTVPRAGSLWLTLTMLVLSVIMLVMLMMAARDAERLRQREADVHQRCEQVQLALDEHKVAFQRIEDARHDILQVMGKVRAVGDVPVLDAPLLVATATSDQALVIHVPDLPETSVEVIVDASWKPRKTKSSDGTSEEQNDTADTGKIPPGQQQWIVKLAPGQRYLLKSKWKQSEETTIAWTIQSSDPEAEGVSHELPIPKVRYSSWSVSNENYLSYPNAINRVTLARSQPANTLPPNQTTRLVDWGQTGKRKGDDQLVQVRTTVSLRCAGPPKMYAGHATFFSKPGIELRYDKEGLFDVIER